MDGLDLLSVKIADIRKVNEKIRLVKLGLQQGPLNVSFVIAGQWLDTYVPGIAKPGGFTIASAPSVAAQFAEPYFELAVQAAPENPVAAWLWQPESEILGKVLEVRVGGSFVCPPSEGLASIQRIVLVAGGVGINPLVSILGYIADENKRLNIQIVVLYSTKVPQDGDLGKVLFLNRIVDIFRLGQITGEVKLFLTGLLSHSRELTGETRDEVNLKFGRMAWHDLLSEIHAGHSKDSTLVYVCGPPTMTNYFVDLLTTPAMAGVINAGLVKSEKWW
ncbi:NADH-cytochrome b-5 reductase [Cordyceps javanica]|nr:NADH-cytochrome b-5 reductase [Cordyceps javanica]